MEIQVDDEHHFRKPANDITSQLEINFGDLGRPGRGRGGPRGGRGGRGRGAGPGPGAGAGAGASAGGGETTRPIRGGRGDKVHHLLKNKNGPPPLLNDVINLFALSPFQRILPLSVSWALFSCSHLRLCPMWMTQRRSQPWVKSWLLSLRSTGAS